jgi:hypothetical protein
VFDLRPALEAAAAGGVLNARQLEGVASSMESAFALRAAACAEASAPAAAPAAPHAPGAADARSQPQHPRQQQRKQQPQPRQQPPQESEQQPRQHLYPALAALAAGIQPRELATLQAIRSCIR